MQRFAKLDARGRLTIPAAYRKAAGLKIGDEVILRLDEYMLRIFTANSSPDSPQDAADLNSEDQS